MSKLQYHQFPYMNDNYGVLVHSADTGETACIDAGDAAAYEAALKETGWKLSHIFITHHHGDHTAGLAALKQSTGAKAIGPAPLSSPINGLDSNVNDGDTFSFAGCEVKVIHTPGHTTDMMNFYLPSEGVVFTGDTLFTLGCGRVFEGDMAMMWSSLEKLIALPADTIVYSSHEYTQANAAFAQSVDPDNEKLKARSAQIDELRSQGKATVPTTLAEELETNPFVRPSDPAIRAHLGMADASDAEVFAEIRTRKDNF